MQRPAGRRGKHRLAADDPGAQAAGITPLYYIWTDYGATPLATVESELQNAITWYGVASPMFDGTSASASEASYYEARYNYAVAAGAKASAGVAAFAGCEITGRSGSYILKAISSGLSSATSSTFRISSGSSSTSLADVLAHLASG